jgi:hypothetical protein
MATRNISVFTAETIKKGHRKCKSAKTALQNAATCAITRDCINFFLEKPEEYTCYH